jgi:pyruvate dehydrogenase E2 component (dihydrolipoamide acetyltransferase)
MAKQELVMPQMGESITTGTITKWHKKVGDKVELDEILFEISTDKVESEIPSPFEGRITELLFDEGDTIDVGKVIAYIEDDASAVVSAPASTKTEVKATTPEKVEVVSTPESTSSKGNRFYTPLVRKLAQTHGLALSELDKLEGTGLAGRVNKNDFMKFVADKKTSGAVAAKPAPTPAMTFNHGENVKRIPMDNMRKAIAKNMVQSKLTSPHVNSIGEVDLTHLVKFRESFKDQFFKEEGIKLTYTPFILKAIIDALKEHPMVNASIDGDDILVKKDINLGCAVAVPGNGLVVPVIKRADELSMRGLCRQLNDLANKARSKKLTMDELTGGTFTFTNVGSFGTLMATPVILQPQVGIFASGAIVKRPVVINDDAIAVRHMMYGTHTYDHRLVDGELGGLFLESVLRNLRNMKPENLF